MSQFIILTIDQVEVMDGDIGVEIVDGDSIQDVRYNYLKDQYNDGFNKNTDQMIEDDLKEWVDESEDKTYNNDDSYVVIIKKL